MVSQGFEGDMAAGAAGVGAASDATQGGYMRLLLVYSREGYLGNKGPLTTCSAMNRWFSDP